MSFLFNFILDQYKSHEKCANSICKDSFMLKHCHNRYKTQEISDTAVDDFLPALCSWLVCYSALFKDDILFFGV